MIKSGDIIKHKVFQDVAVQVMFVSINPETEETSINGVWLNQGQTKTYGINEPANFVIKKHQLCNWLKCMKPGSSFIRNEEWTKL